MNFGRHYQIIFEHSPLGIVILDFQGRIILSNEAAQRIFQKSASELQGANIFSLCSEEFRDGGRAKMEQVLQQRNSDVELECRFPLEGTENRWVRMRLHHVGAGDFSPFIFGILEDVTRHKRGEERLLREKEEAEKATQIKSAFLANMSHEIRTPIHTITGMTELLLETRLDEEQKEYATQVKYSAEVLLGLINDILDFSKIEAGKLSLEIIPCELGSLIEEAVDMVSLLAHKKGLEIIIDIAKDVPTWVLGDPVRIRQILINLINNAVKFTQKGEVLVRVRVVERDTEVWKVKFEVIDTGIGIPEDKVPILFEAFTQVDSSTTRKFGGTGLGLSISKSLVQMMHGSIGVQSTLGIGSNFHFTLPLQRVMDHEEEAELVIEEPDTFRPVLIVEDNQHVWEVLYYHLTDWFRKVEWARTGQEALQMLRLREKDPYHLVLVDQHLPGMDGWQFASEVRNASLPTSPRLILMSPLGFGTEAKMKLLGWFSGYIDKPVKRRELLDCIVSILYGMGAIGEEKEERETDTTHIWVGGRVLVAEDHLVNQQLFKTILEKYGLQVLLAENGLEAVDLLAKEPVDLVFMDVQMPVMNGYEASLKLREKGYTGPIVAVTANAVKGEKEKCLEAGMDDYLTKPFKSADLIPFLEKYMPKQKVKKHGKASNEFAGEDVEELVEEESELKEDPLPKEVFDYPEALQTFMGKADVVERVVEAFRKKVVTQISQMRDELEKGLWDSLRVTSHGIKGGSWNLQARRLGNAAAELEQASKDQDTQKAREALHKVEEEFRIFQQVVEGWKDRGIHRVTAK
ncbi:MAG: response regulator [Spirochaetes bacterium]|nr:response regulator [Spirochaetota bacterium]